MHGHALLHLAALGAAVPPDSAKTNATEFQAPNVQVAQDYMIERWQKRTETRDDTAIAAAEFSAGLRGDGWAYQAVPGVPHRERATWYPAGSELVLPLALGRYMLSPYWGLFGGFNSAHRGLSAAGLMHAAQVAHLPISGAGVSPVPLGTGASLERLAAEPGARLAAFRALARAPPARVPRAGAPAPAAPAASRPEPIGVLGPARPVAPQSPWGTRPYWEIQGKSAPDGELTPPWLPPSLEGIGPLGMPMMAVPPGQPHDGSPPLPWRPLVPPPHGAAKLPQDEDEPVLAKPV